ncbi:MAG: hypothetical protein KA334_02180 [Opitutaceae bacterium]|nr:hypothetical protein [Opitutaceae bacterium]
MKRALLLAPLLALAAGCQHTPTATASTPATADSAQSATRWTATGLRDEHPFGGYFVRNNVWGVGPGPQQIWADSHARWGVHADHPATEGVKSYPHAGWEVGRPLRALQTVKSRFAVTVPDAGSYNSAYDIWCEKHAYEIMLWFNWRGKMGPIARSWDATGKPAVEVENVTVGGHTWDIYKGTNGYNVVISFMCTSQTTAAEVDVKAILDWIEARGWFAQGRDVLLDEVQFGWEIADSPGGLDFAVTDFAVEVK